MNNKNNKIIIELVFQFHKIVININEIKYIKKCVLPDFIKTARVVGDLISSK